MICLRIAGIDVRKRTHSVDSRDKFGRFAELENKVGRDEDSVSLSSASVNVLMFDPLCDFISRASRTGDCYLKNCVLRGGRGRGGGVILIKCVALRGVNRGT